MLVLKYRRLHFRKGKQTMRSLAGKNKVQLTIPNRDETLAVIAKAIALDIDQDYNIVKGQTKTKLRRTGQLTYKFDTEAKAQVFLRRVSEYMNVKVSL